MAAIHMVDNTDWLKTCAIILVGIDHFGHFFVEDDLWWSTLGRMAAPTFFFLMGYANTRSVPLSWIVIGAILTLLESWNADWSWVSPNILLSFALIRFVRPYVLLFIQNFQWLAFVAVVGFLLIALPLTSNLVDYGAEGWLWALCGLCQRIYVDYASTSKVVGPRFDSSMSPRALPSHLSAMRLISFLITVPIYVWFEQMEYAFSQTQLAVFVVGIIVLSLVLIRFQRGRSPIQPPPMVSPVLRFVGRHTLAIYAIQLACSELIIGLWPDAGF
ncbi:MAG: TraX family protein [Hyphomicrobium sp.]